MATPEQRMSERPASLSLKQASVLKVIARGNPDGTPVTRKQILERINYEAKMDSVVFILRYMLAQKRITKAKMGDLPESIRWDKDSVVVYTITDTGRMLIKTD